ncbi:hypothetical protein ABB37_03781 [Leptomonas pyrrhocoris]|uniref:Generative cell specific-1/HAP2 domain-containing protein n=1 Tax=Leptomonas pyrrhocoris TaxID=157538 RepID=A0A0M9G3D2_LEPPY|nr:hypothetical protein ABB37_03781 [Leptomonas pyrrhocoris]KPA81407.1 hypothetical protein ABB37_03781 [Leptomonas pyrrhocoris]|eukprot:XP_015659846.1 hypothetical protein ABB37_03781 [Leptomonas pyrrhocoris]
MKRSVNCYVARSQRVLPICVCLGLLLLIVASAGCASAAAFTDGTSGGATGRAFVTHCEHAPESTAPASSTELGGCQRKLVVDLTLDDSTVAGSILEADVVVSAALNQAVFSEGEMASAGGTATTATTLQVTMPPFYIRFRRGGVQMRYGLTYLRDFPAALRDYVQALRAAMKCDDGVTRCPSYTPLSRSGETVAEAAPVVVANPLGVCCLCTSVECALSNDMCNASMRSYSCFRTAAALSICVREDGARYGGWSISAGSPYYALNTSVSGAGVPSTSFLLTTDKVDVQAGPSRMQLLQVSDVDTAVAGLRLNVSQRVLFTPLSGDRVAAGVSEWMLVPTGLVTAAGNECNKVGITPEYFYSLSSLSQCNAPNGACLANQLEDLRAADVASIAQGGGGNYLADYLGSFSQQTIGARRYLLDEVERSGGATLRWSTNADAITFIPVPVHGSLVSAFYAAGAAQISVAVANSGAYAGVYYVVVDNCTTSSAHVMHCDSGDGVGHACAAHVLVRGNSTTSSLFQMSSAADAVGETASCTIALRDAVNATLDSAYVSWTVETTTTTTAPPLTKAQQCQRCAFHNIHCLFHGVCEWQMLVWTVVALVVTWCPYAILAYWRVAWQLRTKCGI